MSETETVYCPWCDEHVVAVVPQDDAPPFCPLCEELLPPENWRDAGPSVHVGALHSPPRETHAQDSREA